MLTAKPQLFHLWSRGAGLRQVTLPFFPKLCTTGCETSWSGSNCLWSQASQTVAVLVFCSTNLNSFRSTSGTSSTNRKCNALPHLKPLLAASAKNTTSPVVQVEPDDNLQLVADCTFWKCSPSAFNFWCNDVGTSRGPSKWQVSSNNSASWRL